MRIFGTLIMGVLLLAMLSCGGGEKEAGSALQSDKNPVIENIMARRSIRKYKPGTVDRKTLEQIMLCGINAPNGQNKQSWEIRVVDNPATMEEIKNIMASAYPEEEAKRVTGCFRDAPVMVFIARDLAYDFSAYDCGLLAENMMLSATSLGVGSVCLGSPVRFINDNPACAPVLEKLGFSEGYKLALCVGFGYADETPAAKPRDVSKIKFLD
ncbi:MAG: nitroreductase family protein [Bacteroidaceae bacterium]|nr:nitroreductase family protein [Bacteroidaceae bacterium]